MSFNGFNVFVGNLPATTTGWDVENWLEFEQLPYVRVLILQDPKTGKSKRCGFIRVANESHLQPIIDRFHGSLIEGKQIRVSVAKKPAQRRQGDVTHEQSSTKLSISARQPSGDQHSLR